MTYWEEYQELKPEYKVYYDIWSGCRYNYEGRDISLDTVTDLVWWDKSREYERPYRLPESNEFYYTFNPGGSTDYKMFELKRSLEDRIEKWKTSISPSHPLTIQEFTVSGYDSEHGWESVDDAEIVLVHVSYARIPIFAIKLVDPVKLREPNRRFEYLQDAVENLSNSVLMLRYTLEDLTGEGEPESETFVHALGDLIQVKKFYEKELEKEEAKGRS